MHVGRVDVSVFVHWDADYVRKHSSAYSDNMGSDWLMCVAVYGEGTLVTSTHTDSHRVFTFDSPSIEPLCSESSYVPLPTSTDEGMCG